MPATMVSVGCRCRLTVISKYDPGTSVFMGVDDGAGGNQSLFKTIADLVGAIEDPSNVGAAYSADITTALGSINRGLDKGSGRARRHPVVRT